MDCVNKNDIVIKNNDGIIRIYNELDDLNDEKDILLLVLNNIFRLVILRFW